jgi:CRP-like cAMP-binding protein
MVLVPGRVLQEEGEPVDWFVFPDKGLLSNIVRLADGRAVEASAVGPEGIAGLPAFFGGSRAPMQTVTQLAGSGFRLRPLRLMREAAAGSRLRILIERYANAMLGSTSQSVACIRFHDVVTRCARWLLVADDAIPDDRIELTHEFLSAMLGVRRAGVTEAIAALTQQHLIESRRGEVTVLDRPGLERMACECYRIVRQEMEGIFR